MNFKRTISIKLSTLSFSSAGRETKEMGWVLFSGKRNNITSVLGSDIDIYCFTFYLLHLLTFFSFALKLLSAFTVYVQRYVFLFLQKCLTIEAIVREYCSLTVPFPCTKYRHQMHLHTQTCIQNTMNESLLCCWLHIKSQNFSRVFSFVQTAKTN